MVKQFPQVSEKKSEVQGSEVGCWIHGSAPYDILPPVS